MAPQTDDSTEDAVAALAREFSGQAVLIADDDEFIRSILLDMLCDTGLALDEAQDGLEAVAKCRQTRYALVLMDMLMPGLTGVQATRQIRQLPGMEHTPILAITGNSSEADRSTCLQAGMNDLVTKPVRSEALAAIVLRWLRHGRS
jgi:CheY-like chemotaxis protein